MSALASPARMDVETQLVRRQAVPLVVSVYVLRLVARNGVPAQEQEDLAQEILVAAWQGWPGYDPDREGTTPRGWLCGIVANKVVDRRRKTGRDPLALAADDRTLETLAEETMVATEQRSLLARLSAVEQRVIFYREDVDLTFQEIAQVEKAAAISASGEPVAGEFVTSETDARRHYQDALTRLRRMVARDRQKYGAIVPLSFKSRCSLPTTCPSRRPRWSSGWFNERAPSSASTRRPRRAVRTPLIATPASPHRRARARRRTPSGPHPCMRSGGLRSTGSRTWGSARRSASLPRAACHGRGADRQHRNEAPEGAERAPVPVVVASPLTPVWRRPPSPQRPCPWIPQPSQGRTPLARRLAGSAPTSRTARAPRPL